MKPYYDEDGITIYHGDCREVLPGLVEVDMVFTSPPYNLCGDGQRPSGGDWSRLIEGYDDYTDDLSHADYVVWQKGVLTACWDVLTEVGAIYYQHKQILRGGAARLPFELVPNHIPIRQVITWDRASSYLRTPTFYVPRTEWILLLAKPAFRIHTLHVEDVWREAVGPNTTGHPAPFPIGLPARAITTARPRTVLDPFMGGGTTLRAAKDAGCRAIGIEISERYCEIAAKRLAQGVLDFGASA